MNDDILDFIPQIVWKASPDGSYTYLNRRWYDFTGRVAGSDVGSEWLAAVHPEDQERTSKGWLAAASSATDLELLYRLRTRDGDYRWVVAQASPRVDFAGKVMEWFGTCTDAHERVLAQQALEETHSRTAAILDSLPQVIWMAGPDGSMEFINGRWALRHGTDVSPGQAWKTVHPDDVADVAAAWTACLESGEPFEKEFRSSVATGEYRWMLGHAVPEQDEIGHIVRWYGTTTDVHDRVMAQQVLSQTMAINKSILESSPDRILLMEPDGTLIYVNPWKDGALQDDARTAMLGACWFDLLAEENRDKAKQVIESAALGETVQFSARRPLANGREKWFDVVATPAGEPGLNVRIVVVARDITRQKEAERALAQKEALYRGILEASADCIKLIDSNGRLELMNSSGLCSMELDDFAQVQGKEWTSLWPRAARKAVAAAVADGLNGKTARFTGYCPTATGKPKWWDVVVTPMSDDDGKVTRLLSISRDITAGRDAAEKLRWASEHDALTSLPNRRAFEAHLQASTIRAMENGGSIGLLLLDLDHFKHVNDSLGHMAGDHLLKTFGTRLLDSVRSNDFVARLSGDEFAVVLQGVKCEDDLVRAGESILDRLHDPITFGDRVLSASASIGGAIFPRDAETAHELFKNADTALYALKGSGRGGTRMFHHHMRQVSQQISSQLSLARSAITRESVIPHYQQKIDLKTGRITGFEALLRWNHPTRGIQLPDTVAEAFKDYELASKIGELMQNKVFSDMARWISDGVTFGSVSINAAPAEFLRDDYAERLLAKVEEYGVPPSCIEVEVTEHVFLDRGMELVTRALKKLHDAGVRISLDDFGTGYSSLSHLRDFPVDVVKIDRSFVEKMTDEPEIAAIVAAVIDLGRSLSIDVVAEGVETEEQIKMLIERSCALGQGYFFGRAVRADEVSGVINSQQAFCRRHRVWREAA